MTVKYYDENGVVTTEAAATKVEPVQLGSKYLITAATNITIKAKDLIEITT